ncbi:MAG TPA: hypothetical protein VIF43_00450 [Patescibacteria group bacterium]|jgi:hypothetical protein
MRLLGIVLLVLLALCFSKGQFASAGSSTPSVVGIEDIEDQTGKWICLSNMDDLGELWFQGVDHPVLKVDYFAEEGQCKRLNPQRASVVKVTNYYFGVAWGIGLYYNGQLTWQDVQGVAGDVGALNNAWFGYEVVHRQTFDKYGYPRKTWTVEVPE